MVIDEQNFISEYEKVIMGRRGSYGHDVSFDYTTMPVLPFEFKVSDTDNAWGYVKLIEYEQFKPLNDTYVEILKGKSFQHRVSYNGEWVRDRDGNIQVDDVRVPAECVAIRTSQKLVIRLVNDRGEQITIPEDYGVIDYEEDEQGRPCAYLYYIPKTCVYRVNALALCVAKNTHGNVYCGKAFRMQNGEEVFLYTIPYSRTSESEGTNKRIISIKVGVSNPLHAFDKEINALVNFWRGTSVSLPNISLVSFVKAYTRYFDAVKTSKNEKIRARGSLRLPTCRIMLRCVTETEAFNGYCDMYDSRMQFTFFSKEEKLRKFYWNFNSTIPEMLYNVKITQVQLERIGVRDNQSYQWLNCYMNKFNALKQSGQCNICRTNVNFSTWGCSCCDMCTNEERVYYAIFNEPTQTQSGIRWFPTVIFNPSIMGVQTQTKHGANLVMRNLECMGADEYLGMSITSLASEKGI